MFNISLLAIPSLVGAARNSTGSYVVPMLLFASINVVGMATAVALKFFDACWGQDILSKKAKDIDAVSNQENALKMSSEEEELTESSVVHEYEDATIFTPGRIGANAVESVRSSMELVLQEEKEEETHLLADHSHRQRNQAHYHT